MTDKISEFGSDWHSVGQESQSIAKFKKIDTTKRPEKERYYLNIAKEIATRCRCFRSHHGCIIVKDDQIVATGYVGSPRKTKDCVARGHCIRNVMKIPSGKQYEICRSLHSEQNCIINAARSGANILNGDMYLYSMRVSSGIEEPLDSFPCFICKKMIINAGINRVIGATADGGHKIYHIEDWVKEWQNYDMVDDKEVYNAMHKGPSQEEINSFLLKIKNQEENYE